MYVRRNVYQDWVNVYSGTGSPT